ncbi:hypothetical protein A5904_06080 [Acidithiobacillus caldus]|uniref:hypothetical protein n=1 Tax=Acidithiobacillus caldus TaxID=33059 RepID=UPI0007D8D02D|nr:hypothetical protein [Acidithiobacillus caldus]AUW32577.1 hypothetical protein A5904_06080 [Acidithiobacillus caldus]QER44714.1 hypothetical protein F0726_01645 [Acidithiobacillus caldus]
METQSNAQELNLEAVLHRAEKAGYPPSAMESLRSRAQMLKRMEKVSRLDMDELAKDSWLCVAEHRLNRAKEIRKEAERITNAGERLEQLQLAKRLETQAQKLSSPSVDEKFRARAVATELSIRLDAQIRGIRISTTDVEPSSLRLFESAFKDYTFGVESLGVPRREAEQTARLAFLQAMEAVEATPDDPSGLRSAIVQFRRQATHEFGVESGHLRDVSVDDAPEVQQLSAPDSYAPDRGLHAREDEEQQQRSREAARLGRVLSLVAAAELPDRYYAVYRVLADNTHLFEWKIEPEGKLRFIKRAGAERGENIAAKVMEQVGGYSGRGAAYRAVHETIDRLGEALQKLGRNVTIDDLTPQQRVRVLDRLSASDAQIRAAADTARRERRGTGVSRRRKVDELE